MPRPKLQPWTPTAKQREFIRATEVTSHWLANLSDEILGQYRGKWIAAKDCNIVASAETRKELDDQLGPDADSTILYLQLPQGPSVL